MVNEIVLYQADELAQRIEVRIEDNTVWLNRQQISSLFNRDIKTVGKHINNAFTEGELEKSSTVANFATVQNEGGRKVERHVEHYNLDVIISVSRQLKLDIQKANEQYGNFKLKTFCRNHDRFLIIDNEEVYHLGASLKDLGKKWFAFSKMDKYSVESIVKEIKEGI